MCSTAVSPELSHSIIQFSHDLASLRVPDAHNWREGAYELPELVADRGFRASHIGYLLGKLEGVEDPERVCSQVIFRDLPRILGDNEPHGRDILGESASLLSLEKLSEICGSVGDFLIDIWREGVRLETPHAVLAQDAYFLSEAFSLLEQQARGNATVGSRLAEISQTLTTPSAKELFKEALGTPPFRYWLEFSPQDPVLKGFADYIFEIGKLRLESRSGWQYLGIRHESVAAHTFRAAQIGVMMAFLSESVEPALGPVNPHHVAAKVTMHENGETRVQDANLVAKSYVSYREDQVVEHQTVNLGVVGEEITRMWKDVEFRSSPSGKISKDVDRLEMMIEAANLMSNGITAARAWIDNTKVLLESQIAQILSEAIDQTLDK